MNEQLKYRLKGMQGVLMAHHGATRLLPNAAKGSEREVLLREFLEKVFPAPYRFGCGAITDSYGKVSGQLDIIVEWPFFASFPAPVGTGRLYLAESVAFVIEVKSDLSSQWSQVEETVRQLWPLQRRWRSHIALNDQGTDISHFQASSSRIPCVAVGFVGYNTSETLKSRLLATPEDKCPDLALTIESGAYAGRRFALKSGEEGLFNFCLDCSLLARNVLFAEPDLVHYFSGSTNIPSATSTTD